MVARRRGTHRQRVRSSDGGDAVSTKARVIYSRRSFRLYIPVEVARKLKLNHREEVEVIIKKLEVLEL